jgi:hypothetical protein
MNQGKPAVIMMGRLNTNLRISMMQIIIAMPVTIHVNQSIPMVTTVINQPTTMLNQPTTMINQQTTMINQQTTMINQPTTMINQPTTMINQTTTMINQTTTMINQSRSTTIIMGGMGSTIKRHIKANSMGSRPRVRSQREQITLSVIRWLLPNSPPKVLPAASL